MIKLKDIFESFFKTFLASCLMIIVLIESRHIFKKIYFSSKEVQNIILLISLSFIGISIYLLSSLLLKNTEILIFKKKSPKKYLKLPISLLSPFKFLAEVSKNPEKFKVDYSYKINIYISSKNWEIRNIGIKLIGLYKDETKADFLLNILKSGKENGFIRRNSVIALEQLNIWRPDVKELLIGLLQDSYYEVRVAAIHYLAVNISAYDYQYFQKTVHRMLKKSTLEEKIACLRLIAKIGDREEINHLRYFYLSSNSIIREELIELLYSFYRRNIISGDRAKELLNKILITSNNLKAEFRLKSLLKKIYEEID